MEIRDELRKKFPDRKLHVHCPTGNHPPIGTQVTIEQIYVDRDDPRFGARDVPGRWQSENLKATLKAQNLDTGESVVSELARYATFFGEGKLPLP